MATLEIVLSILSALVKIVPTALIYWAGKVRGQDEAVLEQKKRDLDEAAKAIRASRRLKHDPDSVQSDPQNRDNWE